MIDKTPAYARAVRATILSEGYPHELTGLVNGLRERVTTIRAALNDSKAEEALTEIGAILQLLDPQSPIG